MSLTKSVVAALACFAGLGIAQNVHVANTEILGNITSINAYTVRDLGFHGQIGKWGINSYGDTFHCSYQDEYTTEGCTVPLAANSASLSTDDPQRVEDFNLQGDNYPQPFVAYDYSEEPNSDWGMGITNVVETGTDQGIVFFARNHRPGAQGGHLTGGGVAVVDTSGDYPTTHRTATQWWDADNGEPVYGDHGAIDGKDGFIYAFGGLPGSARDGAENIYVARVLRYQATNLNMYQYWNGQEFSSDRLRNPSQDQSVFSANQGTPFWSNHYDCWMYISRANWDLVGVSVRTSENLHGPWSDEQTILSIPAEYPGQMAYAPTAQTQYDESGKSLVVSYTMYPNCQQAAKVTFE
ncbi:MAG: hypothetical protein M1831_002346 [Alyxoria varia]|nr:MAG: hypothetical protein M1831_002346 [Alyxoria varia]